MMGNWRKTKIGEFLTQQKRQISIDSDIDYKLVTISNKGEVKLREVKSGATISAQKGYIAKKGDFIYSRLSVHTGAFGIVPDVLDGALITNEMPCFKIDNSKILPDILTKMIGLPDFLWQLKQLTQGMGRVRIKENMMLSLLLCLPYIEEQQKIVSHFKSIETEDGELKDELTHQQTLLKKLRQQILQEAIEGKLTEDWRAQNPDVEPACELLKRIQEEKCQLIKDKKIKKQRTLPGDLPAGRQVSEDEKPFELPEGWIWCRLGEICDYITKGTTPSASELLKQGEIPYLKVYNIVDQKINFHYKPQYVSREIHEQLLNRSKVFPNDVLMNIVGPPLGKIAIVPSNHAEWNINQAIAIFRAIDLEMSYYIYYFLREGAPIRAVELKGVVGQDNISLTQSRELLMALPPLPEQKAIVAKVEKLLTICDQLETQITTNQNYANALMQAVLQEAFLPDRQAGSQGSKQTEQQVAAHA